MTDRPIRIPPFGLVPFEMAVNGRQSKKETIVPTVIANGLPLTSITHFQLFIGEEMVAN